MIFFGPLFSRKEFLPDNSDPDNTHSSGVLHESNKGDRGWAQGAPFQDATPGLPSVRLWTAALRTGSPDGGAALQVIR